MLKLFTWLMKPAVKRALDKVANDPELKEIENLGIKRQKN